VTAVLDPAPAGAGGDGPPRGRPGRRPPSTPFLVAVRIILLLGGGLLTVCLLAGLTYSAAGVLVRTAERADTTLRGRIDRVEVHVSGSVEVHPGPEGRARVQRRSDFSFDRPQVRQEIVDGVLELRYGCRDVAVICGHHIDLAVPHGADLVIEADHVVVADTTGSIRLRSGGGTVELERVAGPIDAQVGGGAIIGRDVRSTDVRASAGGGSIEIDFSRPPQWVDVSAGAGHIGLVLPRGQAAYRVDAEAGVGESQVSVRTDPGSDRVIRARAGAGDVVVRYGPA